MSGIDSNLRTLYYKIISSPFLLHKFHLDILCRIVFNISQKFVLPLILIGINADCRRYISCSTFLNLKTNIIKAVFFRELVNLCKMLSEFSCLSVNPDVIIDTFETHKIGENYICQYLEIQRGRDEKLFLERPEVVFISYI